MGQIQSRNQFTEEELQDYEDLTFFTKNEVLRVHKKFKKLSPEKVGHDKNAKLLMNKVLQYPELKSNPFGDRVCKVFSTSNDGDMTFEDFLDMFSVFSQNCPKKLKAEYAFRILDFDGDDMIGANDIRETIERIIGPDNHFNESEMKEIIKSVLEESDLDDDGSLSFPEFEHVVDKSADFMHTFLMRL